MSQTIALTGRLDFVSLPQLLQFLASNTSTGALVLKTPHSPETGLIYFKDGKISDAYCEKLTGINAVYALFGWSDGEFHFDLARVGDERRINQSLMEIIMNGVRLLDEGKIKLLGPLKSGLKKEEQKLPDDNVSVVPRLDIDYSYVVAEETFPCKAEIVEEGNFGNWICVILDGYADVLKNTKAGQLTLCRIGPGSLIGDIAIMLKKENVRKATVKAVTDVTLGVLDLDRVHRELAVMPGELKRVLLSLNRRLVEVNHHYSRIHSGKKLRDYVSLKGKKVFTPGEKGNELFFVTEGYASVVCKSKQGFVKVAELEPGDFVGPAPFLDLGHEPHNAVILPSEHFTVSQVATGDIVEQYENSSNMIKCIAKYISNCVAATTVCMKNYSPN